MYDDGPIEINKIKFTDYDTVIFPGKKEMTTDKFFTFFEKMIKKGKIKDSKYDEEIMMMTFLYKKKMYAIYMENTSSSKEVILLNLIRHEETMAREKEYKKRREEIQKELKIRQDELLKDARCGNISSEEVKQLYLEELRESLTIKGKFKKIKEIRKEALNASKHNYLSNSGDILVSLLVLGVMVVFGFALLYAFPSLISCIIGIELIIIGISGIVDSFKYDLNALEYILEFIYKLFKSELFSNKTIKHKIEYLEKIKFASSSDIFGKINKLPEPLKERIMQIQEKLNRLNENDRRVFLVQLKEMILEYGKNYFERVKVEKLPEHIVVLDNILDNQFMISLDSFENKIDKLYGFKEEVRTTYAFTGEPRIVDVSSKKDVKVLKRSYEG